MFKDHPDAKVVAQRLDPKAHKSGKGWVCRCPCHDDDSPSLSISNSSTGQLLWHCFAGCDQEGIKRHLQERLLYPLVEGGRRATVIPSMRQLVLDSDEDERLIREEKILEECRQQLIAEGKLDA